MCELWIYEAGVRLMKELIDSLHEIGLTISEAKMLNVLLVINKAVSVKEIREVWHTLPRTQVYHLLKKLQKRDLIGYEEFSMRNVRDKIGRVYFVVDKFEIPLSKLVKNKIFKLEDNLDKAIKTMKKIRKGVNI